MKAKYVALDLEMEQPSGEIIQVGVAWLDAETGVLDSKNFYITPSQCVSEFIRDLTGITDDDFDWSKNRRQCYSEFTEFMRSIVDRKTYREYITWGGGDVHTLAKDISFLSQSTELDLNTVLSSRRHTDVKTLVLYETVCAGRSVSSVSLSSALRAHNVVTRGRSHDAGDDAYNTLYLFLNMVERQSKILNMIGELSRISAKKT